MSYHLTNDSTSLWDYIPLEDKVTITFGNGEQSGAVGVGHINFVTRSGKTVRLQGVLHVPGASCQLVSVRRLTQRGAGVTFGDGSATVTDRRWGHTYLEAVAKNGLYCIDASVERTSAAAGAGGSALLATANETPELWHRRYAHLGYNNLARLVNDGLVNGIGVTAKAFKAIKHQACEPCALGKQARLSFTVSGGRRVPERKLALVHMDLCGPMPLPSLGGARYIATFLVNYTKLSVVRMLRSKRDAPAAVEDELDMLETSSGERLLAVRTDRGSEYVPQRIARHLLAQVQGRRARDVCALHPTAARRCRAPQPHAAGPRARHAHRLWAGQGALG